MRNLMVMTEERRRTLALSCLVLFSLLATIAYGPGIRADLRIPTGHFLPILFNADSLKADGRVALDLLGPKATILLSTNALIRQPLDQESLALLILALQRNRDAPADLARGLQLLPRFGWRNNDAMFLLYRDAVNKVPPDFAAATRYADALLRREQNVDEVFALLAALEQNGSARAAVIDRLAAKPGWRLSYLAETAKLPPAAIAGRLETVRGLAASAAPLDPRELAVLINSLVALGDVDPAYRLWLAARGTGDAGDTPWDGDFRLAAAAGTRPAWLSLPFEWNFGRDPSFSIRPGQPAEPAPSFDWDGQGRPIFAWQQVRPLGQYQRLTVAVPVETGDVSTIGFRLSCPKGNEVVFDMHPAGHGLLTSDPADLLRLGCPFPLLEVRGTPGDLSRSTRFSIKSIKLQPVGARSPAL